MGLLVTMHEGTCDRKSNPKAFRTRDWTYCLHKPECPGLSALSQIKNIYSESVNLIDSCNVAFETIDW